MAWFWIVLGLLAVMGSITGSSHRLLSDVRATSDGGIKAWYESKDFDRGRLGQGAAEYRWSSQYLIWSDQKPRQLLSGGSGP